ncbi:OLC1v1015687C1 [Oldenlandia corymbosa var. corymbosa]|uniref:OLC1v1015687C1 n=1 Tax=Oldenlandia corymbosa var. corymbosa TaxID=529605 RepID=A0AAV1E6V6_OLDCO|nr:OLC1v1015687C1 [Oldenlandia corymbosa var. corymbosa]
MGAAIPKAVLGVELLKRKMAPMHRIDLSPLKIIPIITIVLSRCPLNDEKSPIKIHKQENYRNHSRLQVSPNRVSNFKSKKPKSVQVWRRVSPNLIPDSSMDLDCIVDSVTVDTNQNSVESVVVSTTKLEVTHLHETENQWINENSAELNTQLSVESTCYVNEADVNKWWQRKKVLRSLSRVKLQKSGVSWLEKSEKLPIVSKRRSNLTHILRDPDVSRSSSKRKA